MKNYELSDQDIAQIAEKAAEKALQKAGLMKSQVSTNEAHKRFGRKRVTDWRKRGLVTPIKQGGIIYWRVEELEKAALKNLL
jgi:hypothetical protein